MRFFPVWLPPYWIYNFRLYCLVYSKIFEFLIFESMRIMVGISIMSHLHAKICGISGLAAAILNFWLPATPRSIVETSFSFLSSKTCRWNLGYIASMRWYTRYFRFGAARHFWHPLHHTVFIVSCRRKHGILLLSQQMYKRRYAVITVCGSHL